MFLDEDKAGERLASPENLINKVNGNGNGSHIKKEEPPTVQIDKIHNGGRRPGDKNLPYFMKEVIGTLANLEPTSKVARAFNISKSQTDQYKEGETTHQHPNKELQDAISRNLGNVRELALEKLMKSLNIIDLDPESPKVKKTSLRDMSSIARNMSSIVEKTMPKQEAGEERARIVIYAPTQKEENYYQTVITKSENT